MRNRVERLRVGLVGSAVFLMLVIAAFVGYAHIKSRLNHLKLPAKLGIDVVRESGGWTFSRSSGSRTLYTIHAARSEQHTSGKVSLHDVYILLYGKDGNRRDRICGQDFEYDEKAGVVRALGQVHIDLQATDAGGLAPTAPANAAEKAAPCSGAEDPSAKMLHVTTSGLVYLEKLGVAATSEYIEFRAGEMTGHATGADFSSDSGMLMLHSAVSMNDVEGGEPVQVTASTAEYDERNGQAFLTHARYVSPGRTAEADQATLHRRTDGTLSQVEAQGTVTMTADGATMAAHRADVVLNAMSRPESAILTGGVLYTSEESLRQTRGQANEATIRFDAQTKPQPERAVFTGGVHMIERTRVTEAVRERWSVRELTATKLDAALARSGGGNAQLRTADASGGAHLSVVNNGSLTNSIGPERTELSADDLHAVLRAGVDSAQPEVETIAGRGHAILVQITPSGVEETTASDILDAKFRPTNVGDVARGPSRASGQTGQATLWNATQEGHVVLTRRTPSKKAGNKGTQSDDVQRGLAERAVYDGDANRVTLTGDVHLADAGSSLWTKQVTLDRATGDSKALGGVKVNYDSAKTGMARSGSLQQPAESTHVLAEGATLEHATQTATFYGKPARLWQGGSQIQAPEIEVSRAQQWLIARGAGLTGWSAETQPPQVHTVLMSVASPLTTQNPAAGKESVPRCGSPKGGENKGGATAETSRAVHIASGSLVYSGSLRQADFTGGVRADTIDATIRASGATAYLQLADVPDKSAEPGRIGAAPSLAGALERVVAVGGVGIERSGLRATGERLVYTANDRVFLLTGDKNNPPKAIDAQGTTTGAALRFNSCDDSGGGSVEALGTIPGTSAQRVHTESHVGIVKKKEKSRP